MLEFSNTEMQNTSSNSDANKQKGLLESLIKETDPIRIERTEDKGRFVVSSRQIEEGEIIMRSIPYTVIVCHDFTKLFCRSCTQRISSRPEICKKCHQVVFCNDTCAVSSNPETFHSHFECQALQKMTNPKYNSKVDKDMARILIHMLSRRFLEKASLNEANPSISFAMIEELVAEPLAAFKLIQYTNTANMLLQILDKKVIEGLDIAFFLNLISKVECNNYGIWNKKDSLLGRAVYLNCSLFNHSCFPNCARVQEGRNITIRTLFPLAPNTECTIKYIDIDTTGGREGRRKLLKEHYQFTCICSRCVSENEEEVENELEDFVCSGRQCNGLLYLNRETNQRLCSICGKEVIYEKE